MSSPRLSSTTLKMWPIPSSALRPRPVSGGDLALMRRIDELHLDYPCAGSRMLQGLLRGEGLETGRLHVATLMKKMGIEATYRRPNTSKPAPGHKIHPYLLQKLAVTRPNQVWAMDLTYIPMARGFVYLCAVVDWFSRRVLSWRLSITMETAFCIEAIEEAIARYGKPDIFNRDQGSQFTSVDFTAVLKKAEIAISMFWLIKPHLFNRSMILNCHEKRKAAVRNQSDIGK
jgi:putative transposase